MGYTIPASNAFGLPDRIWHSFGSLLGKIPKTLLEEMEVGMKMIQFICGTMVGGMIGVSVMCLMQINRLYKHDREVDE